MMTKSLQVLLAIILVAFGAPLTSAYADTTKITFVTDWKAQTEQGGFYQAVAEGLYEDAGLDVKIRQGGPAINIPQLLAAGAVDFAMGSNSFIPINLVVAGADAKAVMASFQKDPQVLITHKRDDIKSIADMRGRPIMISDASVNSFWVWLKAKYDFQDEQIRKYTFNMAPFIVDKTAIQQGYVSSEPYLIKKEGDVDPQVFLLADEGYPGYGAMILASGEQIRNNPDTVQAFVNASILGWKSYLHGDPSGGNALIKADNEEMTDEIIAQAIDKMRTYGIVDSGDTEQLGIGAMTDERWKSFFDVMAENDVFASDVDYRAAYSKQFVNKGLGTTDSSPTAD